MDLFHHKIQMINVECCMPQKWREEEFAQVKTEGMNCFDMLPERFPSTFILFTSMEVCLFDDYFKATSHLYTS
jgi:hypothetical protein